jgi:hypothetical protein
MDPGRINPGRAAAGPWRFPPEPSAGAWCDALERADQDGGLRPLLVVRPCYVGRRAATCARRCAGRHGRARSTGHDRRRADGKLGPGGREACLGHRPRGVPPRRPGRAPLAPPVPRERETRLAAGRAPRAARPVKRGRQRPGLTDRPPEVRPEGGSPPGGAPGPGRSDGPRHRPALDRGVSRQIAEWAEEVVKLVRAPSSGALETPAVQRNLLAEHLGFVLAVHRRRFWGSESEFWERDARSTDGGGPPTAGPSGSTATSWRRAAVPPSVSTPRPPSGSGTS